LRVFDDAAPDDKSAIEVGLLVCEGMSNMLARTGDRTFLRTQAFVSGQALRIRAKDFVGALAQLTSLDELTLRYKEAFAPCYGFCERSCSFIMDYYPDQARTERKWAP
jgi:hypothetical protein